MHGAVPSTSPRPTCRSSAASAPGACTTHSGTPATAWARRGSQRGPSRRWASLAARALAAMPLDRRDAHTRLALVEPEPVRVPPEPFRYAGGTIVRAALVRRERLEEEGRRADPLTRFVAGVPARIGIHVGR